MEAPEYYEHVRLRDVFMRDTTAVKAMIEHVEAVTRSLGYVAALGDEYHAKIALKEATVHLITLKQALQAAADEHNVALAS